MNNLYTNFTNNLPNISKFLVVSIPTSILYHKYNDNMRLIYFKRTFLNEYRNMKEYYNRLSCNEGLLTPDKILDSYINNRILNDNILKNSLTYGLIFPLLPFRLAYNCIANKQYYEMKYSDFEDDLCRYEDFEYNEYNEDFK